MFNFIDHQQSITIILILTKRVLKNWIRITKTITLHRTSSNHHLLINITNLLRTTPFSNSGISEPVISLCIDQCQHNNALMDYLIMEPLTTIGNKLQFYIIIWMLIYRSLNSIHINYFYSIYKYSKIFGTMSTIVEKDNQEMPFADEPKDFHLDLHSKYFWFFPIFRNTIPESLLRCLDISTGERVTFVPLIPKIPDKEEEHPLPNCDNNFPLTTYHPIIVTSTAGASLSLTNSTGMSHVVSDRAGSLTKSLFLYPNSTCKVDSPSWQATSSRCRTGEQLVEFNGTQRWNQVDTFLLPYPPFQSLIADLTGVHTTDRSPVLSKVQPKYQFWHTPCFKDMDALASTRISNWQETSVSSSPTWNRGELLVFLHSESSLFQ